jgi:hypothetical protein
LLLNQHSRPDGKTRTGLSGRGSRRNSKRRDALHFSGHSVHETLMGHTSSGRIEAPLVHHTFETTAEVMQKLDLYTDLASIDLLDSNDPAAMLWLKSCISPLGAFVKW